MMLMKTSRSVEEDSARRQAYSSLPHSVLQILIITNLRYKRNTHASKLGTVPRAYVYAGLASVYAPHAGHHLCPSNITTQSS